MSYAQWFMVAGVIVCAIVFLFFWHRRTWIVRRAESTSETELRFHALQYRRRMQTTGMMGCLAVILYFGQLFKLTGWIGVFYWGTAFFLAVWLIFMAFGDVTATRVHVARFRQSLLMERAKLQKDINQIRQRQSESEKSTD